MIHSTISDTTNPAKPTLIVVLGMHRSGTSVLTRAMGTLGAEFGNNLMKPVLGVNDKGFFEDLDIYSLNVDLLHATGADWHTMGLIDINVIPSWQLDQLQMRAIALLRAKCLENHICAVKDPRMARLLSFWLPVFAKLDVDVRYLIAIRNPISVARSLAQRDNFPVEKSYILWLAHTVSSLELTQGMSRALVDYDRLIDSPRRELECISNLFSLPLIESRLDEFENIFLDNELRHTRHTVDDLQLIRSASRQVKGLYSVLFRAASDLSDLSTWQSALAEAKIYLEDIAPILRCMSF